MTPYFTIMGIVNVTPDSFSDGGMTTSEAVKKAVSLWEEGADYADLGAESSRPGATPLTWEDEWQRLHPVLRVLAQAKPRDKKISVDSYHHQTLERALDLGIDLVNNIKGVLTEGGLLEKIARSYPQTSYLCMHMHGRPQTMQAAPLKTQETFEVTRTYLRNAYSCLRAAGFSHERLYFDPGVGFGKTDGGNFDLMARAGELAQEFQLAYGISRKGFLGRLFEIENPQKRDDPTNALELGLIWQGVRLIRTYSVKTLVRYRRLT